MLPIPFDKIDAAYLLALPGAGGPPESRTVDYKRDFTRNNRDQIEGSEFRADVSAFANSEGGDLILGVDDVAGLPVKVEGIPCPNADALKVQLDGMIKSVEPRLTSYTIHPVMVATDRAVVVIRIRPSFAAPHRTGQTGGFHYRTNSGKDAMSVDQVREAFVASAGLEGRLRAFRDGRLGLIGKSAPYTLVGGPRVMVHVMPLVGATRPTLLDIVKHRPALAEADVLWLEDHHPQPRINFDGLQLVCPDANSGVNDGYAQWFRSGFLEIAWGEGEEVKPVIGPGFPVVRDQPWEAIDEMRMGRRIFNSIRQALAAYPKVDVPPPYFIGVSLTGCRGYEFGLYDEARGRMRRLPGGRPVDIDRLIVPEVFVEDIGVDLKGLLRPVFNQIANAFGRLTALDYE